MTCIVGVETDEGVWIGGDRAASNGYGIYPVESAKIFRNEFILMGYTTSFRFGQIMEHALSLPKFRQDEISEEKWLCTVFVDTIRATLKSCGYAPTEDGKDRSGTALLAFNGKLWNMQSDLSILRVSHRYSACGSGQDYALGALCAAHEIDPEAKEIGPEDRLRIALRAAALHSTTVDGPFDIEKL